MKRFYFTILLSAFCMITVFGQNTEAPPAAAAETKLQDLNKIEDSGKLFEERGILIDDVRKLDQDIDEQAAKLKTLPSADILERDLRRAKLDLEKAQKATPALPEEQIESLQRSLNSISEDLQIVKNAAPQLQEKRNLQEQKRRRLADVEQRIASLFDATRDVNRFKATATVTFGLLVLIVVGGFYLIAWYKDGVAAKIFAGEMGMQFVTLFLIVIAIILFGIMGTLEGRELAALLGGLSGYILGKSGSTQARGGAPGAGNVPEANAPGAGNAPGGADVPEGNAPGERDQGEDPGH